MSPSRPLIRPGSNRWSVSRYNSNNAWNYNNNGITNNNNFYNSLTVSAVSELNPNTVWLNSRTCIRSTT